MLYIIDSATKTIEILDGTPEEVKEVLKIYSEYEFSMSK